MSLVGDRFREHRGRIALGLASLSLVALIGCGKLGDYNHSVVPPVPQTPEQQQRAGSTLVGSLNRAAGCPPTDNTCRQRLGRGALWGGTVATSVPRLGPNPVRF